MGTQVLYDFVHNNNDVDSAWTMSMTLGLLLKTIT